MNTIRKELEFPAPPEGWEIDRYGRPKTGEMFHVGFGWRECIESNQRATSGYLIARRKQSPAEWANAQPDLAALARVLPVDTRLVLCTGKNHYLELGRDHMLDVFTLHADYAGQDTSPVVCRRSRWEDTP